VVSACIGAHVILAAVPPVVTWLGQAGFRFEAAGRRILVDPFFSEHEGRRYPPPPVEGDVDWLLVTHEHLDHFDPASLRAVAERSADLTIVAPAPLEAMVREAVPDAAFAGVARGERVPLGEAGSATVVPAVHALHPRDGYADDPRFVGYVLELDGVTVYHAGDTLVTDEVVAAVEPLAVDIALLPVNGRTYFREQADLAGNLDARDAVALASRIGASVLVPIHWDLFEGNTEHPGRAADEAAETEAPLHVLTLRRGLPWTVA
jgi:L-ascorbate 6-phosphate lactonase